jgi:hypothetical protein
MIEVKDFLHYHSAIPLHPITKFKAKTMTVNTIVANARTICTALVEVDHRSNGTENESQRA